MNYKHVGLICAAIIFVGIIAIFKQELIAISKPAPSIIGDPPPKIEKMNETPIEQRSAQRRQVQWVQFDGDLYIDPFSKAEYSVFRTGITTLTNFDSVSSAQMFGLSEVETIIFDCQESKMSSAGTKWYEGKFATGGLTKEFPAPLNEWYPISRHYLRLFAETCDAR